jgi:hypothetical protein
MSQLCGKIRESMSFAPARLILNTRSALPVILLFLTCLLPAGAARGQTEWLTVLGDRTNPAVDTIEVDPSPMSITVQAQTMRVRVSRAQQRKSWDGVAYRSYTSDVVFDCANKKARYAVIAFHREPLWQGVPHKTSAYPADNPRWMEFRDVKPNPTQQLIRAACESGRVKTSDLPGGLYRLESIHSL